MQKKTRAFFGSAGFYMAMVACLAAAGVLGYRFFLPSETLTAEEPVLQAEEPERRPAETVGDVPLVIDAPEEETAPDAPAAESGGSAEIPAEEEPKIVAPLAGQTIAAFSADVLAYNEALADWRTHNGVDIAAEEGTAVCAACAGTVESVLEDPLMGTTVVIAHQGGYTSTYANLSTEVSVSAGDKVAAGDVIGAVGATAAAESGAAHLHFSVSKNGDLIDPEEYLSPAE